MANNISSSDEEEEDEEEEEEEEDVCGDDDDVDDWMFQTFTGGKRVVLVILSNPLRTRSFSYRRTRSSLTCVT